MKKIYGSQADDFFGASVSINGDTLVVGAFGQGSVGSPFAGEAYIFERNQGGTDNWGYVQTLRASDRVAYQYFGYSVSISGDTLVVGAYGRSDSFGSAYVFQRQPLAWNEVQKITPTDAALGDRFGWCVSISGDRVVVGSPYDDDNGGSSGAAYIFYRDQGGSDNWGQVRKITPADGFFDDGFGWSVSIGGNKVVIGSPYDDDNGEDSGSAYVFYRNRGGADNWGRVKKITPGDGQTGDHFGFSISINGDTAVVGARHDDDNGEDSGSGYIFYRDRNGDNNWGQVRKITPSNGSSGDEFGSSVSISGGTALVGAYLDDDGVDDSGSAYVFYRDWGGAANWGQVRKTFPSGGGLHHSFAFSVSVSGDTVVVGAPYAYEGGYLSGAAYIFSRDRGGTDNWGQVRKIVPGGLFGNFGLSVSISGHTVVVGDPYDDDGGQDSGAAYIFYRNRGGTDNWGQVRKIFANDADVDDLFGWSVSISGDTVVIGAPFDEENGDTSGSAYVFYRDQGGADSWGHVAKILPDDGSAGDRFGWSVSVSDRTAVIGAPYDQDNGLLSGSAYIFSRTGQSQYNWHQLAKITPNQGAPGDEFGDSVSVSGDAVAIGARGDDDNGNDAGAAYVYYRQYSGQKWPQVRKITPTGGSVGDWFGDSVSISGDWLVVGAPYNDDNGGDSGTAYVFCRTRGGLDNWGQVRKILTNDGEAKDLFGWSASISDGTVVIGAPYDDDNGEDSGSAYIFRKGPLFPWLILLLLGN